MDLKSLDDKCREFLKQHMAEDAAHDINHTHRVVANATEITAEFDDADLSVVRPAAWLHDCIVVPKDDENRSQAAELSAQTARRFLRQQGYDSGRLDEVAHAIEAHSYSGSAEPETLEAEIVQDADRLDALGAIGVARCMMVGGQLGRVLYHPEEPIPETRQLDDNTYTLDHFFEKLLELPDTMKTAAGRREAKRRVEFMRDYVERLESEISSAAFTDTHL